MRRLLLLPLAATLLLSVGMIPSASAHPLGIATWSAIERPNAPNTWTIVWRTSARQRVIPPTIEGDCSAVSDVETSRAGTSRSERWTVRCERRLSGLNAADNGDLEVMVHLKLRTGEERRARLSDSIREVRFPEPAPPDEPTGEPNTTDSASSAESGFMLFVGLGFEHVLEGYDHLLFVLVLLMLAWPRGSSPSWRTLLAAITGFTIAHSLTLALSVLGWVSLPAAPIEAAIAWSVVVAAAELIRGRQPMSAKALLGTAGAFGLLHGFGFAGALGEVLGQPDEGGRIDGLAESLIGFNVGVELGQLLFATGAVGIGALLGRGRSKRASQSVRVSGDVLVGYGVGLLAALWMFERLG